MPSTVLPLSGANLIGMKLVASRDFLNCQIATESLKGNFSFESCENSDVYAYLYSFTSCVEYALTNCPKIRDHLIRRALD